MKNNNITKKLQKKELEILDYFVSICKKYNLKYYLAYGTCLGAVRHNGFIPWDDDVDVCMPIDDYLKLKEIMVNENSEKFYFQTFLNDINFTQLWYKIRLNNTLMVESGYEHLELHKGIYIDIFPLIPYPNNVKDAKKQDFKYSIVKILLKNNMKKEWSFKNRGKAGRFLTTISKILPRKLNVKIVNRILMSMYSYNKEYDNYLTFGKMHFFNKSSFDESIEFKFENKNYNIPKGYDIYLSRLYGDYMKLPPLKERYNHAPVEVDFGE